MLLRVIATFIVSLTTLVSFGQTTCAALKKNIETALDHVDAIRESERYSDLLDSVDILNDEVNRQLQVISSKPNLFNCDLDLRPRFYYLQSADGNFAIASWDTRQGGTMIDYTNTTLIRTTLGVAVTPLKSLGGEIIDNTQIMFDTLVTVIGKDGAAIYVALGSGQASSALPFQVLKAFSINGDKLSDPRIFPDRSSEYWIQYDLHEFEIHDRVDEARFISDNIIELPVVDSVGKPTGEIAKLKFDGSVYAKQE